MLAWLANIAGPQYVPALLWTFAALVALVVVLVAVRIVRRASSGTFVAGGRNRKTRLAVMDATAVDSHRRLVLVRRDDVEHLLLIGGSNDIVVEQNIRLNAPARRPGTAEAANHQPPRPRPPETLGQRPAAIPAAPLRPASPAPQARPAPPSPRPQETGPENKPLAARPIPAHPVAPAAPAPARPQSPTPPPPPKEEDIDETLLQELEVSLDNERAKSDGRPDASLEDEMTRLLGELSGGRK